MPELKLQNSLVDERYAVSERLNWGSYAEIWIARDQQTNREVALKTLNTSLQGTPDPELERTLIENFQNEAIALDRVRHPHVILRLGHGTAADLRGVPFHYLVLEYMPGGDLSQLCRGQVDNCLSLERVLFYLQQACEGLAFAHQQGIIHRDIKPNNFLLSAGQQTLKIADFGVAKLTAGEAAEITRVGTNVYAPPEHHPDNSADDESGKARRVERLTAAADIYSLAKSVYTLICGRTPSAFVCQPITALPAGLRDEPWAAELLRVLQRATANEPALRYATIIEFWSDLANVAVVCHTETDEETQVRPRLNVNHFHVPTRPEMPAFTPVLASSGELVAVAAPAAVATLEAPVAVAAPVSNGHHAKDFNGRKIVVDLPRNTPAPAVAPAVAARVAPPPSVTPSVQVATKSAWPAALWQRALQSNLRRKLFPVLLAIAFIGILMTVYQRVRQVGVPVGFGQPSQVEITRDKMNVRETNSQRSASLGLISGGSRHRALDGDENGWLRIEVTAWDEAAPHTQDKTGWIYVPGNAKVTARRW